MASKKKKPTTTPKTLWLTFAKWKIGFAETWMAPALDVVIRFYMASIFFKSGLLKLNNWGSTLALFQYEHPVPGLSPHTAALLGTGGELILPVLLALGIGARIGAAGLLFMTAVIEFTYQHFDEHYVWAMLLCTILLRGPGRLSMDYYIRQKFLK